jgi:hypothetical protein
MFGEIRSRRKTARLNDKKPRQILKFCAAFLFTGLGMTQIWPQKLLLLSGCILRGCGMNWLYT